MHSVDFSLQWTGVYILQKSLQKHSKKTIEVESVI